MAERELRAGGAVSARGGSRETGGPRRCPTCGGHFPRDFLVCPKDATPLDRAGDDDPLIGEVLAGAYRITGTLGEGGMGRVYHAQHVRLPRRFAVKVLLDQLVSRPDAVARFEREAQAVARIANPHVLDVVDILRIQGRPCMVTELLEGEDLSDMLDRVGKLPLHTAIALCRQVCRGLSAAHAASVIHRDLKPSNLFLIDGEDGVPFVKILDFGIAKVADGAQLTRTGMVLGTPAYMAPEQARGSNRVDARVDVYALGAVLYRMLTGRPPFPENDPGTAVMKLLNEDPRRPRDLERSIPEGVEALIQHAMARNPEQRPDSIDALERLLVTFDDRGARSPGAGQEVRQRALDGPRASSGDDAELTPKSAELVTRRARRARPAALAWAIVFSLFMGVAVLGGTVTALRVALGPKITETEVAVAGAASLGATLLVFLFAARVLFARWRSAPVVERLGAGLRAAFLWLTVPLAALTAGARAYPIFGSLPRELVDFIEVGTLGIPILAGLCVFTAALWRARRS
jgi:serine/threonine-protein kinase